MPALWACQADTWEGTCGFRRAAEGGNNSYTMAGRKLGDGGSRQAGRQTIPCQKTVTCQKHRYRVVDRTGKAFSSLPLEAGKWAGAGGDRMRRNGLRGRTAQGDEMDGGCLPSLPHTETPIHPHHLPNRNCIRPYFKRREEKGWATS